MSQIVNNRCKISMAVASAIIRITGIPFDQLFIDDGRIDTREFYGDVYVVDGRAMRLPKYKTHLSSIHQKEAINTA